ncbi:MAG: glycosyltransferase [Desulfobacterales bacterium]
MKKQNIIDIIIPSYNSKKTIIQCLESVFKQSYKNTYKVIVVDSSNDGTDEIIRKFFPQVHLIYLDKQTYPGAARNIGVQECFSKYIGFTDTDCIVDYYWIDRIIARMTENQCDAVGGSVINGTPYSIIGTLGYFNEFSAFMPGMKSGFVKATATANVCYKKDIFKNQMFIESSFAGEDTVFHWTILENGGSLFFDPSIKVTHLNKTGMKNVLQHQLRIGQGAGKARILLKKDLVLIHFPVLCILILPWIRFLRMQKRIFHYDKTIWKKVLFFSPLSFLISYSWCIGFFRSVKTNQHRKNNGPSHPNTDI